MNRCRARISLISLMILVTRCDASSGGSRDDTAAPTDDGQDSSSVADSTPDSSPDVQSNPDTVEVTTDSGGTGGDVAQDADASDSPEVVTCHDGLPARPFSTTGVGFHRHDVAGDFALDLADGTQWRFLSEHTGCDVYLFIPDSLTVSAQDPTPLWKSDLGALLAQSPPNVHYFFATLASTTENANANIEEISEIVSAALDALPEEDAAHWQPRLHVAAKRAGEIQAWPGKLLKGIGIFGFGIDRAQRIRGLGSFADVARFDAALDAAGQWPWKGNLAYAANEARAFNAEASRDHARLDPDATVIPLWQGETLAEFAEVTIDLPPSTDMARFDSLTVVIDSRCPNLDKPEFGNCGAWDYIAALSVVHPDESRTEIARFITSYHRETRWIVDATAALPLLAAGGPQKVRWEFAPPWNTQPTRTFVELRLSNRANSERPTETHLLWSGGSFGSGYDALHPPKDIAIPPAAARVELWALITGHGAASNQCAEFCNHQHQFIVNGNMYTKTHPSAGTNAGCIPEIDRGMIPNQGGTWWFGRGGWCPGQQVDPWIVDVTSDVEPGAMAQLEYHGIYAGGAPPDNSGDITASIFLVIYE